MAQKLNENEIVSFKDMLITNSIMVDALAQLLIEKGVFTQDEFHRKLKQVQAQYATAKKKSG